MRAAACALLVLAAGAAGMLAARADAAESAFRNPIAPYTLDDQDSPDPQITYHDGFYYLIYSPRPDRPQRIEIRKARSLAELPSAPRSVVWDPVAAGEPLRRQRMVWAPEINRLDGPNGVRWYLYYAASGAESSAYSAEQRMHVLESAGDDPLGPYHFKADLPSNAYAIDGHVWRRPTDGKLFMFWSGQEDGGAPSIYVAQMATPWSYASKPVLVSQPTYPWEVIGLPVNEGPQVIAHGDKLNVVYSASWCPADYEMGRVTVPLNADLLNPGTWAGAKHPLPVFTNNPAAGVYGPGHGGFFKSPDGKEDWLLYHAQDKPGGVATGGGCFFGGVRTARVQRFTFNADGTPDFGAPAPQTADLAAPSGDPSIARQTEDVTQPRTSPGDEHAVVSATTFVGGSATELRANAPGDFVTYPFDVPRAGTFDVKVRARTGPDRGRVTLAVDEATAAALQPADGYAAKADDRELDFGRVTLGAGRHDFTFTLAGRSPSSTGFVFAPDQVRLVDVPNRELAAAPDLGLPTERICLSRRRLRLHLHAPAAQRLRSAVVYVDGRRVRTLHGPRPAFVLDLRGRRTATVRVRVIGRTTRGRKIRATRRYRTCVPKLPQEAHVGFHEFQADCSVNRVAPDDPIVFPKRPGASHSHTFIGARTSSRSTTGSLGAAPTSCVVPSDHSSYWFPTMLNGDRVIRPQGPQIVYYKSGVEASNTVRAFPRGLRFVLGSPKATAAQFKRDSRVSGWSCGTSANNWDFPASCPVGSRLLVRYKAPSCWDGKHLDSPDHRSHMAYPVKGSCPAGHPVAVPMLEYKIAYPVAGDLSRLRLSSGRGYSWHADFFSSWDMPTQQALVTQCIDGGGQCDARGFDQHQAGRGRVLNDAYRLIAHRR